MPRRMTADDYKEKADACRELARQSRNPDHRRMLIEMAESWDELSETASKTAAHTVRLKPFRK